MPRKARIVLGSAATHQVLEGGRGAAKSYAIADSLLVENAELPLKVLCAREIQNSIKDSVHHLLEVRMQALEIENCYSVTDDHIRSGCGGSFIFKGLKKDINTIRSMEGIDRTWVAEAEKIKMDVWDVLLPTVLRKPGSIIIVDFNPENEKSDTYNLFVKNPPPSTIRAHMTYRDNDFFPDRLREQMEYCKRIDHDKYMHIWEGQFKKYGEDLILKNFIIEEFEAPSDADFRFGADFGFSKDPSVLGRMYVRGKILFIDYEAYGHGIEIHELPSFYDTVPGVRKWKITADSERPDTISYINRQGFNIVGAKKGKGSVEDGIQFLRGFEKIIIHPRCTHAASDFGNYRWKRDKISNEILAIPAEGSDHWPDAARYALEDYMKAKEADIKWL